MLYNFRSPSGVKIRSVVPELIWPSLIIVGNVVLGKIMGLTSEKHIVRSKRVTL